MLCSKENKDFILFTNHLGWKENSLVTFIVKDYVTCEIHVERPLNINASPVLPWVPEDIFFLSILILHTNYPSETDN